MDDLTFRYLAKLGIVVSNDEEGFNEIQRIDNPGEFAFCNELDFIPDFLESDAEARELFDNISIITLDDETITEDEREIIIEDCYDIFTTL